MNRVKERHILIIQTAFIGDSILATSLIEEVKRRQPNTKIHFLIRKGNEAIARNNPNIFKLWIWDKSGFKYLKLFKLAFSMRAFFFESVLNIHRHASSGWVTAIVKAKNKVGFDKNPLSFFFNKKVPHHIPHMKEGRALHEVQRNYQLLAKVTEEKLIPEDKSLKPALYFTDQEVEKVNSICTDKEYLVMVPASVWFTKQWPKEKWQQLVGELCGKYHIYLTGAPGEKDFCDEITGNNSNCTNLCGKVSLTESALLMKNASRVFVNDSSALHLASAVNAKTTAIFNSTLPEFGYYPLADDSIVIETRPDCKPCGLHGHRSCPKGHYKCAMDIEIESVVKTI
jgi:ADP-heptose:LPS heptosyltransferase